MYIRYAYVYILIFKERERERDGSPIVEMIFSGPFIVGHKKMIYSRMPSDSRIRISLLHTWFRLHRQKLNSTCIVASRCPWFVLEIMPVAPQKFHHIFQSQRFSAVQTKARTVAIGRYKSQCFHPRCQTTNVRSCSWVGSESSVSMI